jgi:hypothetical protein
MSMTATGLEAASLAGRLEDAEDITALTVEMLENNRVGLVYSALCRQVAILTVNGQTVDSLIAWR